ncbi:MAG: hypothetical protein NTZ98_22520 [Acidobacteria bacterium]|nr:hypothetical protein [Acidobacteriota bacterium]
MNSPENNLLRQIFLERAELLLSRIENARKIPHHLTVGEIREAAIIDSLRDLIPSGFDVCSGFVTDALGTVSPQIDILLYRQDTLAPIFLRGESAILPFELFRLGIEVKSNLNSEGLKQVESQAKALSDMVNSTFLSAAPPHDHHTTLVFKKAATPFLVVAVDSEYSVETLNNKTDSTPGLQGIIVLKKGLFYRNCPPYIGENDIDRVIRFWALTFNNCLDLQDFVLIDDSKREEIKNEIRRRHPEYDLDNPDIEEQVFKRLMRPNIMPYLYPIKS